jgi:P-type Cu+ transporter
MVRDIVCHMEIDPAESAGEVVVDGKTYYFCSPGCLADFEKDAKSFLKTSAARRR